MHTHSPPDDIKRLRAEYNEREERVELKERYSLFNPAYLFFIQQRQKALFRLLPQVGVQSFQNLRLLEVGCGGGDVLHEYAAYGPQVYGIDLLSTPLAKARHRFKLPVAQADGQQLPYINESFDIVLQYIAFSSILDDSIKANMAKEMLRVLRKPTGVIIWHDFWLNPTNRQTRGIGKQEIRDLFPNCDYTFRRITLAPPLARFIVPFSWTVGALLEKLLLFNSHYLVAIKPKTSTLP